MTDDSGGFRELFSQIIQMLTTIEKENKGNRMNESMPEAKMLDEQTLEVNLPNRIGYERIAMECSASFAKIVGFGRDRIGDLKTAVAEACLNAMEHGNKGRADARVIVTMNFNHCTFSISVMDEGKGAVELPEEPDIEKKIEQLQAPRGLGIFMIRKLVDEVEFNKMTNQGNIVRMVLRMTR
jgi:serine/threonine-protein kinase RsbW